MGLRGRTFLIIATVSLIGVVGMLTIVVSVATRLFDDFDLRQAEGHAERLSFIADQELRHLGALAVDWGSWDDTYEFVLGEYDAYEAENMEPETLPAIGVDAVAIVGLDGELLLDGGHEGDRYADAPADFLGVVHRIGLLTDAEPGTFVASVTRADGDPWLLACAWVTDSAVEAEPVAVIVWGERLDDELVAAWSDALSVDIELAERAGFEPRIDGDRVYASVALPSLTGDPLVMVLDLERDARDLGRSVAVITLLTTLGIAIVGSVVLSRWLDRSIVAPIVDLGSDVDAIEARQRGDVDVQGPTEVARVAESMNALLESLRATQATLEERNEALEEASRAKDEFVSMVSHELRTPLTAIRGFAETLALRWDTVPDQQRQALVERIASQTATLEGLVQDLLTLGRIGHVSDEAPPGSPFDDTIAAVVADLPGVVGALVVTDLGADDAIVAITEEELRRVVSNLVVNADKYGDPPIEVATTRTDGRVALTVRDHGPGVPEEFVPSMWEAFAQASDGDRRTATGVGLGLRIITTIVQARDGSVRYEAPDDGGARFVVEFPLVLEPRGGAAPPGRSDAEAGRGRAGAS